MKVYVVIKVARQELGEYVFVCTERAFQNEASAEAYHAAQAKQWNESIQGMTCFCERAIHVVELE
jgi:hypothetical protein